MSDKIAHGVINQGYLNRKNDYLFRISLKGLIRDEDGNVLVVKESGRMWWDLPGGGMDHGESIKDAIARELHEEVNLSGDFTYQIIHVEEPNFLERPQVWQIRMIFVVKPVNMSFAPGEDADESAFINPEKLKTSEIPVEQRVYEYSQLAATLPR